MIVPDVTTCGLAVKLASAATESVLNSNAKCLTSLLGTLLSTHHARHAQRALTVTCL
jgi:hypothetical protein